AAPAVADRRFDVRDIKADFQELYQRLQTSHFDLYARRPKAAFDALAAKTLAAFDRPLTLFEVQTQFQRFMAFGRVAHSRIDFPTDVYSKYRDGGGKAFPLLLRIVANRAYVSENNSGLAAISLGDEILALNGEPIAAWITRLTANVSADNDYMS